MKLSVITHTNYERTSLIERCVRSVKAALPGGATHELIECKTISDFANSRIASLQNREYIAFVDDDDYIHPDSINLCIDAIEKTGCGAACTNEVLVDKFGNIIPHSTVFPKTYPMVRLHPRTVHHLCVIDARLVEPWVFEFAGVISLCIDWAIKASVINNHGCVHIPMTGYYWTQHDIQSTRTETHINTTKITSKIITDNWSHKYTGKIPTLLDLQNTR